MNKYPLYFPPMITISVKFEVNVRKMELFLYLLYNELPLS